MASELHLALPTGENSRGQNPYRLREANSLSQLSYPTAGMDWRTGETIH
jgi:hypothetical protein